MKLTFMAATSIGLFALFGQQEPPLAPFGTDMPSLVQWIWQQGGLAVAIAILLTVLRRDSQKHAVEIKEIKDEHTREIREIKEQHAAELRAMSADLMTTLRSNADALKEFGMAAGKLSTAVNILSVRVTRKSVED